MATHNEIHNDLSGQVGGDNVQFGVNHGPIWMSFGPVDRRNLDAEQVALLRKLSTQVRSASDRELGKWGIRDGDALPVRWRTAADDLSDRPEKIYGSDGLTRLEGRFTEILDTYEAVPSKRLMILGDAGAGKTVLAHRLILGLLAKREPGSPDPVPVLFSLGGWNPAETELPDWLAQRLVQDFPYLEARDSTTRAKQADLLIGGGFVLPILDGFDEIPTRHHSNAIKKIGTLNRPLIVTSRPGEYATAARGIKAVSGAAAITLEPLTLDEACGYLCDTTSRKRAPAWKEVFRYLSVSPDEVVSRNLTTVLTTPLMVVLARATYNDEAGPTPLDLLDRRRFPTTTVVEDHLLNEYITTVYAHLGNVAGGQRRPNWNTDRARHWLAYLATHLQQRNTHDLTWWHLHTTLHHRTRILVNAAITGITIGITTGLVTGVVSGFDTHAPGDWFTYVLTESFRYVRDEGLQVGLAIGLAIELITEVRISRGTTWKPERLRLKRRRRGARSNSGFTTYVNSSIFEFTVGLTVGLTFAITFGTLFDLTSHLTSALVFGFTLGVAFGLPSVVVTALGHTADPHATEPWTLLSRDRTVALTKTVTTIVLVAALAFPFGLNLSIIGLIAPTRLALSAWGRWVLLVRLWLPLTGRLPWRPKRFLEDANDRGVLRTAGSAYQFRHARLRDHLAGSYRT